MPKKRGPWTLKIHVSDEPIDLDDWVRRYVAVVLDLAAKEKEPRTQLKERSRRCPPSSRAGQP